MSSLQEFFNQPENGKAKGIVQKNNILKRNIIARMAIEGECTLADLARELHVSIPTVTKLVEELLSENIIADRGKIETSGGRRPNIFGLTHSAIYFAGIEVSRDQIVMVITDLHNNIIQLEHEQDFILDDTEECLDKIGVLCNEIIVSQQCAAELPEPRAWQLNDLIHGTGLCLASCLLTLQFCLNDHIIPPISMWLLWLPSITSSML